MAEDYDELNKRLRAEREEQAREYNKKFTAYHTLIGGTFEPLKPITFDPSFFIDKVNTAS